MSDVECYTEAVARLEILVPEFIEDANECKWIITGGFYENKKSSSQTEEETVPFSSYKGQYDETDVPQNGQNEKDAIDEIKTSPATVELI